MSSLRTGYARWLEDWGAAWAEFSMEPEESTDADDHHVITVWRLKATGTDSGVKVERRDAMVITYAMAGPGVDSINSKQRGLESVGWRSRRDPTSEAVPETGRRANDAY